MRVSFCVNLRDQNRYVYEDDQVFLRRLPADVRAELEAILVAQALPIETQLQWYFDDLLLETGGNRSDDVRVQLAPANLHWCSDAALVAIADRAARAEVPLHMHLLETVYQREYATRRTGGSAVDHLERLGILGPAWTLGHGVWLSEQDVETIASSGAKICHNPSSNLRLRSGRAPVNAFLSKGVSVALGIDEAGLNDDRDMLLEARLALHLHGPPGIESAGPSAGDVFRMATEHGALTTGFGGTIGRLDAGARADVTVVDWSQVTSPYLDEAIGVVDAVMRRAKPSMVRSVVVGGRIVFHDGRFTRVDEAAALDELKQKLRAPLPESARRRRRLAAELLPYAKDVYAGWLDGEARGLPR
jgi:cytosine/adenosine deaminase-related metal-dependent hydrolase